MTKNMVLSNMTSGEIVLTTLSSVLLGAITGVITNSVLIIILYNTTYVPGCRLNSSFTNEINRYVKLKTLFARVLDQVQVQAIIYKYCIFSTK